MIDILSNLSIMDLYVSQLNCDAKSCFTSTVQARLYVGAAYNLDASHRGGVLLMTRVCAKDGYLHMASQLLQDHVQVDLLKADQQRCLRKLRETVENLCCKDKKPGGALNTLITRIQLLTSSPPLMITQDEVDDFLEESPTLLLQLTQRFLDKKVKGDAKEKVKGDMRFKNLTIKTLATMDDPCWDVLKFQESAICLQRILSLTQPCYAIAEDTPAASLFGRVPVYSASGGEVEPSRLVIVSWNIKASSSSFASTRSPTFMATKVESIGKAAQQAHASLIVLQECPTTAMNKTIVGPLSDFANNYGSSSTSFFKRWDYCEAQTGGEAAGFLFNPLQLDLVSEPVAYHDNPYMGTRAHFAQYFSGNSSAATSFERNPVLAIFRAKQGCKGGSISSAEHLGLIVVVNVHLKAAVGDSPNLPRAEMQLLGTPRVQEWIDQQLEKAVSQDYEVKGPHCVLIMGDFNLAAKYCADRDHGDYPHYTTKTRPGHAWDRLLDTYNYECLLRACDKTNCGPPVTRGAHAYDNALVRFIGDTDAIGLFDSPEAFVMDLLPFNGSIRAIFEQRLAAETDVEARFNPAEKQQLWNTWSDHKPIYIHI